MQIGLCTCLCGWGSLLDCELPPKGQGSPQVPWIPRVKERQVHIYRAEGGGVKGILGQRNFMDRRLRIERLKHGTHEQKNL